MQREEVYNDWINGLFIEVDDVLDYVKENYDKDDIIELFDQ